MMETRIYEKSPLRIGREAIVFFSEKANAFYKALMCLASFDFRLAALLR